MPGLRFLLAVLIIALLSGCVNGPLDPAPYDPTLPETAPTTISTSFTSFSDSESSLTEQAQAYERQRDYLIRTKPYFDLPVLGLGIAGIANAAFDGAHAATAALGLATATGYGISTYFGLSSRITAYNSAYHGLACGANVAHNMVPLATALNQNPLKIPDDKLAVPIPPDGNLQANIALAQASLTGSSGGLTPASPKEAQDLLAAQNAAVAADAAFTSAMQTVNGGPIALQSFASQVRISTDSTVMNGQGNPSQILKTIQASLTPASPQPAAAITSPWAKPMVAPLPGAPAAPSPTIAVLINDLTAETVLANQFAAKVNAAWSPLASCVPSS